MSRDLAPPLPDLVFVLAEEGADDEAGDRSDPVWAALLLDGSNVRRRVLEQLEDDEAAAKDAVDPDDWEALRGAYGLIIRRDNRRNVVTARVFADEEECLSEWEATRAGLEASPPAVEAPDAGDTTEGPSSGPLPPRDNY
jgi:hypothetical protein